MWQPVSATAPHRVTTQASFTLTWEFRRLCSSSRLVVPSFCPSPIRPFLPRHAASCRAARLCLTATSPSDSWMLVWCTYWFWLLHEHWSSFFNVLSSFLVHFAYIPCPCLFSLSLSELAVPGATLGTAWLVSCDAPHRPWHLVQFDALSSLRTIVIYYLIL